jgi:thiamine-monophosphate kinase
VCVTVHGLVEAGRVLRRDAARTGDDVWVTGALGDAAAALVQWRSGGAADPGLRARLDRPVPRVAFGQALGGVAHAAIDVSDGLVADLGHVCVASGVGAEIDVDALPASNALLAAFHGDLRRELQAAGGDDYELCFTAPVAAREAVDALAQAAGVRVSRIGRMVEGQGVQARTSTGVAWTADIAGYKHFRA